MKNKIVVIDLSLKEIIDLYLNELLAFANNNFYYVYLLGNVKFPKNIDTNYTIYCKIFDYDICEAYRILYEKLRLPVSQLGPEPKLLDWRIHLPRFGIENTFTFLDIYINNTSDSKLQNHYHPYVTTTFIKYCQ